ncbi:MAG: hypothetical protein HXM80_09950 [Neisseria sicca]|uniref:Uncharacterized protein n=1 Tax=Neisseria sicca TaxID=490 RepID=A0A930GUW0_NEISI|nr:hypothetical protein [Neisseria sicca]
MANIDLTQWGAKLQVIPQHIEDEPTIYEIECGSDSVFITEEHAYQLRNALVRILED